MVEARSVNVKKTTTTTTVCVCHVTLFLDLKTLQTYIQVPTTSIIYEIVSILHLFFVSTRDLTNIPQECERSTQSLTGPFVRMYAF